MFAQMILMTAMFGQTTVYGTREIPVLSEETKKAQERALAEFRAREHTIQPRLIAHYELENERLGSRIQTVNLATRRTWSLIAGTSGYREVDPMEAWSPVSPSRTSTVRGKNGGFSSIPPTGEQSDSWNVDKTTLSELQRENFLMKGALRDSRQLYRHSNYMYKQEHVYRCLETRRPIIIKL